MQVEIFDQRGTKLGYTEAYTFKNQHVTVQDVEVDEREMSGKDWLAVAAILLGLLAMIGTLMYLADKFKEGIIQ